MKTIAYAMLVAGGIIVYGLSLASPAFGANGTTETQGREPIPEAKPLDARNSGELIRDVKPLGSKRGGENPQTLRGDVIPDSDRVTVHRQILGTRKPNFNASKYWEDNPDEWQFLGYTAKELHDRYDTMSPCKSEPSRFWFGGCGGIEGGGFMQVKYGSDGKVDEVWQCASTCTATLEGPHFKEKATALSYAYEKATRNLQDAICKGTADPSQLRRYLKSRARVMSALGNLKPAAQDRKRIDALAPFAARVEAAGNVMQNGSVYAPLERLSIEFKRNGFQMKLLSPRKYKFFKPNGPSITVTANKKQIVDAEESVWLIEEEIGKEAVKVLK